MRRGPYVNCEGFDITPEMSGASNKKKQTLLLDLDNDLLRLVFAHCGIDRCRSLKLGEPPMLMRALAGSSRLWRSLEWTGVVGRNRKWPRWGSGAHCGPAPPACGGCLHAACERLRAPLADQS